jgi:hypothetical protein
MGAITGNTQYATETKFTFIVAYWQPRIDGLMNASRCRYYSVLIDRTVFDMRTSLKA